MVSPAPLTDLSGARIAFVGINFFPETTGIAPYTTLFAESLANAGAEVEVITGVPHYPAWNVPDHYRRGLRWREQYGDLMVLRRRHFVPQHPTAKLRAVYEASFLAAAMPTVLRSRADAIIAVTPSLSGLAAAIGGRRGRPVGALVQDLTGNAAVQSGTMGEAVGNRVQRMEYRMLAAAQLVGVITPDFFSALVAGGVPEERIVTLANCIHVTPWAGTKQGARKALGWPEDEFLVVYTGSLGRKQGLEVAIEAARVLRDRSSAIRFIIVGEGAELNALKSAAYGLTNVTFVPLVSADLYPAALAAADALLLTERGGVKEMSLPSKLTSYATAGRPIIASVTADGITARLLETNGAALMAEPGDAINLANQLEALVKDTQLANDLAAASARLATRELSADAARDRYRTFAHRLLRRHSVVRSESTRLNSSHPRLSRMPSSA